MHCNGQARPRARQSENRSLVRLRNAVLASIPSCPRPTIFDGSIATKVSWLLDGSHRYELWYWLYYVSRNILFDFVTYGFAKQSPRCGWASVGCYHATNLTLSWRLPLALACVGPLVLLSGLPFIPGGPLTLSHHDLVLIAATESPRYLIWRGHREEARKCLERLHGNPTDPSHTNALAEFDQIVQQVEEDTKDDPTFLAMFKKPSWRKRSLLVLALL